METEGSLDDFTSSEAILGPELKIRNSAGVRLGWNCDFGGCECTGQGFAEVGVLVALSGPA